MSPTDRASGEVNRAAQALVFDETGVGHGDLSDAALAAAADPESAATEPFRLLRTKVKAIGEEAPLRCIGLVSAGTGEGRTMAALGLAVSLCQEPNHRVLLLEADLRQPSIEAALRLAPKPGLADWLRSPAAMVPVRRIRPWGLSLLAGGRPTRRAAELLGSAPMAALLMAARSSFHYVVIDCPPLLTVADTVILQNLLDGVLVVVRERHTLGAAIASALSHLKPELIQGLIYNDHRSVLPSFLNGGSHNSRPKA